MYWMLSPPSKTFPTLTVGTKVGEERESGTEGGPAVKAAGTVAEGKETLDAAGDRLLDYVLEVAGGAETRTELLGAREISIFKDGVVL